MLRIAICDDMESELRAIVELTYEYVKTQNIATEIFEFNHPDKLLRSCENETYHIFLLDMVMPMISGLELGRSVRRISTDAQIIYITTEPSFALDAYSVNPLNYILKPVKKQVLFDALNLAAQKVHFGKEITITLKTCNGLRSLSTDIISSVEYVRHSAIYTLVSGEKVETLTLSTSFTDHIEPLFCDKRFIQPHVSYVVNMSLVERLDREGFTLKVGLFIPISGKKLPSVRNTYMSYRLGEV